MGFGKPRSLYLARRIRKITIQCLDCTTDVKLMSEEMDFKNLIVYLSAVALALFYLVYMPWTAMSAFTMDVGILWIYYFTLVLGLLFPLYYAIGKENMAWHVLGLSIILNSVVLMLQTTGNWLIAGVMTLLFGVFVFIGPILEKMMANNWDMPC